MTNLSIRCIRLLSSFLRCKADLRKKREADIALLDPDVEIDPTDTRFPSPAPSAVALTTRVAREVTVSLAGQYWN